MPLLARALFSVRNDGSVSFPRIDGSIPATFSSFLYNPSPFATVRHSRQGHMQCPTCQKDLVEIPTFEGPQLDVCPGQHGLWLDVGEMNLFVENYCALKETSLRAVSPRDGTRSSMCPKCGGLLDPKSVLETAFSACRACQGGGFRTAVSRS